MPVEIRELVIQAKVREDAGPENTPVTQQRSDGSPTGGPDEAEPNEDLLSTEVLDIIVERCMARMQEWLTEKSMR